MKSRFVIAAVLATAFTAPLGAQCSAAPLATQQACRASVDLINYMTPQLSTAIAGGSSTLGQSGVLGGLGRFALSIRGTGVMNGAFPDIEDAGFRTDGQPQTYTTTDQIVPAAGVDASLGIWKGINLGATHMGGIDILVSALYIPDIEGDGDEFSVKAKDGNLKLGYGLRIGVLDESVVTPGVHISYLQRDLPTVSLSGSSGASVGGSTAEGTFALNDFSVKTTAWRIVAAKTFLIFGLQAGLGQDTYESSADILANVSGQSANATASMKMTRTNMFVGAMINFFAFKLVAEAGQVSGGSLPDPFNNFGTKRADDSRTYLSGGLRIAF